MESITTVFLSRWRKRKKLRSPVIPRCVDPPSIWSQLEASAARASGACRASPGSKSSPTSDPHLGRDLVAPIFGSFGWVGSGDCSGRARLVGFMTGPVELWQGTAGKSLKKKGLHSRASIVRGGGYLINQVPTLGYDLCVFFSRLYLIARIFSQALPFVSLAFQEESRGFMGCIGISQIGKP